MEFILLRILKGRLPLRRGDLSLYIEEPSQDCMYDSINIYEEAYDNAYGNGAYTSDEIKEVMNDGEFWTEEDSRELDRLRKDNDALKLRAYKNFFIKKELRNIKQLIRNNEDKTARLLVNKTQFNYLTCEGIAEYSRWNWIIENNTFYADGKKYNGGEISLRSLVAFYEDSTITQKQFRAVARMGDWRSMWNLSKKTGELFGRPATLLTRDQLLLTSFTAMYDMVYESPEAPVEDLIDDDDCLDGWFIDQRQKIEEMKKEAQAQNAVPGKGGEVFKVVSSQEEANDVYRMNSPEAQARIKSRERDLVEKGIIKNDLEFTDIKRDFMIEQNKNFADALRGKK